MKRNLEIHCINCGVLRRTVEEKPERCPDCGTQRIVIMGDDGRPYYSTYSFPEDCDAVEVSDGDEEEYEDNYLSQPTYSSS